MLRSALPFRRVGGTLFLNPAVNGAPGCPPEYDLASVSFLYEIRPTFRRLVSAKHLGESLVAGLPYSPRVNMVSRLAKSEDAKTRPTFRRTAN